MHINMNIKKHITLLIGGWVRSRTGPDDLETKEISCTVGILTPDRTVRSMVTVLTALLRLAL